MYRRVGILVALALFAVMAFACTASAATSWKVQNTSGRVVGRILPSSRVPGIWPDPALYCYVDRDSGPEIPATGFMKLYTDDPIHYIDGSGGPGVAGAVQISSRLVEVHWTIQSGFYSGIKPGVIGKVSLRQGWWKGFWRVRGKQVRVLRVPGDCPGPLAAGAIVFWHQR